MKIPDHIIVEITAKKLAALAEPEQEVDICHALIGPVWSLIPELQKVHVGSSTIFGRIAFLVWRISMLLLCFVSFAISTFYPVNVGTLVVNLAFSLALMKETLFVKHITLYNKDEQLPSYIWQKSFRVGLIALLK